ncbi:hypothetical protein RB195_002785 [Necator americanus]|uniref:Uncharacterized protein n=1 Tax=Necator americanus TaxID=51031 RepID=A0ABR1DKN4_NECAM
MFRGNDKEGPGRFFANASETCPEDMPGDTPACLDKATPYGDRDDHPTRWFLGYRNTDSDTVARKEEDLIRDPDNYVLARK